MFFHSSGSKTVEDGLRSVLLEALTDLSLDFSEARNEGSTRVARVESFLGVNWVCVGFVLFWFWGGWVRPEGCVGLTWRPEVVLDSVRETGSFGWTTFSFGRSVR